MNYDHATELSNSRPPLAQHKFLVAELGRWARLNPSLVILWAEFQSETTLRGLMANKFSVLALTIDYDLYKGHTAYINELPVLFRKYDGSDSKEVENLVAEALGSLFLEKLREGNPTAWHASQDHSEDPWENQY